MYGRSLRRARAAAGLTQREAAARLGVSQPYYSQLETGSRPLPPRLARSAVGSLCIAPTAIPLPSISVDTVPLEPRKIAEALGTIGYPGFGHLARSHALINPAELVVRTIANCDLDPRLVEAMPWVLASFSDVDWGWLTGQSRLLDLQNRLGYLLELAVPLIRSRMRQARLRRALKQLDASRLAGEGTLCRDSMSDVERKWVRKHRPEAAVHWNLITTLTADQLTHAA